MTRVVFVLLGLALLAPALAHAQSKEPNWVIMAPEPGRRQEVPQPWLTPTYKSPRGLRQHVKTPRHRRAIEEPRVSVPPPPIVVPQTGIALPNLPTLSPSGPRGAETFQDKAIRCTHQAGMYGGMTGDRNAYIGTCVNQ